MNMKKIWLTTVLAAVLLTGCAGKDTALEEGGYRDDVSPKIIVEAVASELGDEYWPDMELAPEYLDDWYGVSEDMYEEYFGQTPMISANVDTLIVVKATDEYLEDVQNALENYREAMVQDTMQYPSNLPKIQASRIETYGNYVCFVQLGGSMNGELDDEEVMIQACQEADEQALAVIEKELTK
jgi:PBP1b-binding outer membrane lipoprotein LpoB